MSCDRSWWGELRGFVAVVSLCAAAVGCTAFVLFVVAGALTRLYVTLPDCLKPVDPFPPAAGSGRDRSRGPDPRERPPPSPVHTPPG